jgi:hypothetical protein
VFFVYSARNTREGLEVWLAGQQCVPELAQRSIALLSAAQFD